MKLDGILQSMSGNEIAIIGMAGRFPGAPTIRELWDRLCDGHETIRHLSEEELRERGAGDDIIRHPHHVPAVASIDGMKHFDAEFFGINPHEARLMDPQQRLFLEGAWEALEDAGHVPDRFDGTIGVFAGSSLSTYLLKNIMSRPDILQSFDPVQIEIGNAPDSLTTRTSYKLNLRGPSHIVQSACSTSLVAVHAACQSLLSYECDMALAGGVSINLTHDTGYFYMEEGIVSPDGHCRPFDKDANGTVFGSGMGIVVLRRLEDALRSGDQILAVVKGSAVNNDGSLKVGYTAPSIDGQAEVIAEAIANAGIEADSITYVEAHGTGTSLGDPIEIAALTRAFRLSTDKNAFCRIGSIKSNLGHLAHAAGVTGLIKTVLALHHQKIPPSLHFREPNPQIDFANSPFVVNTRLVPWKSQHQERQDQPRRAGISSFGFGGTNAHVVLEEAPTLIADQHKRKDHLLILSAKSMDALKNASLRLADYLQRNAATNLTDIAYTLQVGRQAFRFRRVVLCRSAEEACSVLKDPNRTLPTKTRQETSLFFSMRSFVHPVVYYGHDLYETEEMFRHSFDQMSGLLRKYKGSDAKSLLYPAADNISDAARQLLLPANQAVVSFVFQYAMAHLLTHWGLSPHTLIGDEAGRLVSATLSGTLSPEEAASQYLRKTSASSTVNFVQQDSGKSEEGFVVDLWDGSLYEKHCGVSSEIHDSLVRNLLSTVGTLWSNGVSIAWDRLYEGERRQRVSLPTYPFERKKYWIEANTPTHGESSAKDRSIPEKVIYTREEIESILTDIWKDKIGLEHVGLHDHFFESGGDSFLAIQVVNECRRIFQIDLPVVHVYEKRTISELAAYIETLLVNEPSVLEPDRENILTEAGHVQRRKQLLLQQRSRGRR